MKTQNKFIKSKALVQVEQLLDPLQFAYRSSRGVEDAAVTLSHFLFHNLEGTKAHVRLLFSFFLSV